MLFSPEVNYLTLPLPLVESTDAILLPESLKSAHPMRQEKFLAARLCAYRLTGVKEIGIGGDGAPIWPPGFVGAITHTQGLAGAAVSKTRKGIGFDIEPIMSQKTFNNVSKKIFVEGEEKEDLEYATIIFSAKESIYKCLRPGYGKYFGFEAAKLVSMSDNELKFELTIAGPITVRYERHGTYIFTGCEL